MKKNTLLLFVLSLIIQGFVSSCSPDYQQKTYMRKTYKKIRNTVKEAEVTNLNDTIKVLFPSNLMFAVDSFSIATTVLPTMERFATVLNKFDKTAILISGFTDSLGTEEYNNKLSTLRAEMAKKTLLQYAVYPERINTWGMGERHPVAPNETDAGRAKNRRVEFVILYKDEKK